MENALFKHLQNKRRQAERQGKEQARETTQRSEKVKNLKEETQRKLIHE